MTSGPPEEDRPGHGAPREAPRQAPLQAPPALELTHVVKRFGQTVALRDATLVVPRGTLHTLLGENGAGKTTLLHVAFGHLRPDAGRVAVDGESRSFASPADAIAAGLGMVHQHFRLVPSMTVAENVALGRPGTRLALRRVAAEIERLGDATGLRVDPGDRVESLGVAAQQRVEIVKALLRGARVLILDEPTAVLAPSEAAELLGWVRRYVDAGNAAVLITHKLREALGVADMVSVLRRGETVLTAPAAAVDERELIAAMIGSDETGGRSEVAAGGAGEGGRDREPGRGAAGAGTGNPATPEPGTRGGASRGTVSRAAVSAGTVPWGPPPEPHDTTSPHDDHHPSHAPAIVLQLRDAAFSDALGVIRLHPLTLAVRAGEILGVAGVEGAGQHELMRLLAGRLRPTSGSVLRPPSVGFVPEDRHRDALALTRSLVENVALRGAGGRRGLIRWSAERERTARLLAEYDVRGGAPRTTAANLSGGNQQKLVLGRELDDRPRALVVESPTRGLDVRASAYMLDRLRAARESGTAVVVYSSDIDELLQLATRVVVAYAGRVREVAPTREQIGRALVGAV